MISAHRALSVLLFIQVAFIFGLSAQPGGDRGGGFEGEVYGTVIDSVTKEPLEYVVVSLFKGDDPNQYTGMASKANGDFRLEVKDPGTYKLQLSFIGYERKVIEDIKINDSRLSVNLKEIEFIPTMLKEVEISGEDPPITYDLDKKIINVDNQNTNLGQTAVEVLDNAPSISVDIDGNVSLRGSTSFTLLINGVPTAMSTSDALANIPASQIENIEIITNPSAKYDAEGTSGIINIITKKKRLEGVSLLANANYGTFDNYGADANVSIGKEKLTINLGANVRNRHRPRFINKDRITYFDTTTSQILIDGEGAWEIFSYGTNGEVQWEPNKKHNLIASADYAMRYMKPYFYLNFEEYSDGALQSEYLNKQDNIIDINSLTASLFYQYKIKGDKNHHITLKAITSQRYVDQLDSAMYYDNNDNITGGTKYTEVGPSDFNRFNFDYVRPLKNGNLETGAQMQLGESADDGKFYEWIDSTDDWQFRDAYSSYVSYTRDVYAGYAIINQKKEKFSYQLGLRAEYTYRTVEAENFNSFQQIERLDWFPSAHASFQLNKNDQFLINASRRIQRPRSWYFEPFITQETEFNVRTGNPDLLPEYIYVGEMSYIHQFGKKGFISAEAYFRQTNNKIDRIRNAYDGDDFGDNVLITQPYNIGLSRAVGLESGFQYGLTDWYDVNAAFNVFYLTVQGTLEHNLFNNESYSFTTRLTNTFKVEKEWQFQIVGEYNSPQATAQGMRKGYFVLDASVRKSFGKNKYALTLQGRNILGTRIDYEIIETSNLYLQHNNTPRWPMVTLTFSMKLNNYQKVANKHAATDDF